jgi:hypothetical protein
MGSRLKFAAAMAAEAVVVDEAVAQAMVAALAA